MNVLLHSRFYPNIGGIETVAGLLTREWHRAGIGVAVVSDVSCAPDRRREFPFSVHHRPGPGTWLELMRWADVFVHMNLSLRALWPWLRFRRPLIAVHESCYFVSRQNDRDWKENLKLRCARSIAGNIAASQYIARAIGVDCEVIPNPYDDSLFHPGEGKPLQAELAFVGRLVSDKGCDLLIEALEQLRRRGLRPRLTIVGDGPQRARVNRLATALGLNDQVSFAGAQTAEKVADLLRQHAIIVVPSLWDEPFGIVALEGAACGCVVLAADGGALPEVVGPTGMTFRRGDSADLATKLGELLDHPDRWSRYRAAAPAHLARFRPTRIAQQYLAVFERARSGQRERSVKIALPETK